MFYSSNEKSLSLLRNEDTEQVRKKGVDKLGIAHSHKEDTLRKYFKLKKRNWLDIKSLRRPSKIWK